MSKHGKPEAAITREIQAKLTDKRSRMWRNNVGTLIDSRGIPISYGLAPGSSDLIGLRSITITPEMVGTTVAVFCAVEVKRPDVTARPEHQQQFISIVNQLGGRAGFATSVEQAREIMDGVSCD